MTKVDPLKGRTGALPGARRKRAQPAGEGEAAAGALQQEAGGVPARLAPQVEEIAEAGAALQQDPTGAHLDRYKQAVRQFLDEVVRDSMQVSSEATVGFSRKVFSTIARIDVALADLADAVLGRQQDVLKAGAIVDQIKGLIIDLYR